MTSPILYQTGNHYVIKSAAFNGFEVYRNKGVAAVRCASIGYPDQAGLVKAIRVADAREKFADRLDAAEKRGE